MVVVLEEGAAKARRLLITVDRFQTNDPVHGARLEVDAGGQEVTAKEEAPGVYVVQPAVLSGLAPGTSLPLTISVAAGGTTDLLSASLTVPASAPGGGEARRHDGAALALWGSGAALAAGALGVLILRRRGRNRGVQ